jgi:hypothetical protein
MKRLTLIVAAATMLVSIAHAAPNSYVSGNDLVTRCTTKDLLLNCYGYLRATGDTLRFWQNMSPETSMVCIPDRVTAEQLRDIALAYFKNNPRTGTMWQRISLLSLSRKHGHV